MLLSFKIKFSKDRHYVNHLQSVLKFKFIGLEGRKTLERKHS